MRGTRGDPKGEPERNAIQAASARQHRQADLGIGCGYCYMRHTNDAAARIGIGEQAVAAKIELRNIGAHRLVTDGIAKAQTAVFAVEREEVAGQAAPVGTGDSADGHHAVAPFHSV